MQVIAGDWMPSYWYWSRYYLFLRRYL